MQAAARSEAAERGEKASGLMLAFYGDDFTGSTDALEFLSRAGVRTVLFTAPPDPAQLARYPALQAVGIAGMTRSMPVEEMEKALMPAFHALKQLEVPHVHYKICSTFDSSPLIGSIGKAIDIGTKVFSPEFIPLLVAAPALGRYCVFGNLFARMGTGSKGPAYRLDRHPSMSRHPLTPASESDLRLHLSRQTNKKTGLLDILQVSRGREEARQALEALVHDGAEVILLDALYEEQLRGIGELIDAYAGKEKKLFSVGSSGIEMALGAFWTAEGRLQPVQNWCNPGKAESMLVLSGSCSPVTRAQIAHAVSAGFSQLVLEADTFPGKEAGTFPGKEIRTLSGEKTTAFPAEDENSLRAAVEKYEPMVSSLLREGRNVILHTGDNTVSRPDALEKEAAGGRGTKAADFGILLGHIARAVLAKVPLQRLVIAGGDTSGHAARVLGIEAVEMIAPLIPGAPLCRAFAPGSPVDGMEVNFKGGQVGTEDYFEKVLHGIITNA